MSVTIIPDGFPPFVFDAVTSETHEHTNEPTEFPVEVGSDITDHIKIKPDIFTVVGIVSQTPTVPVSGSFSGPLALDVEYYQAPPFQQLSAALAALTGGPSPPIVTATQNALPFDYLSDAHAYFLALKNGGVLSEVDTSTTNYTDMAVTTITVTKKDPGSIELSVGFKHIITVETAIVSAPKPTIPAGSPKASAGPQGPTPSTEELKATALKGIVGLAGL